jgi:hypothetical protein
MPKEAIAKGGVGRIPPLEQIARAVLITRQKFQDCRQQRVHGATVGGGAGGDFVAAIPPTCGSALEISLILWS